MKTLMNSDRISKSERKKIQSIIKQIQNSTLSPEEQSNALNQILSIFDNDTESQASERQIKLNSLHQKLVKSLSNQNVQEIGSLTSLQNQLKHYEELVQDDESSTGQNEKSPRNSERQLIAHDES